MVAIFLVIAGLMETLPTEAQPCTSYLGGTYTVGAGGDFPTLTAAAQAYNTSCLTANVTFELTNSFYTSPTETFPINFRKNTTAGPSTRLYVIPKASLNVSIVGSVDNGSIINISGSYIEINGGGANDTSKSIQIQNNAINQPRVIHFVSAGLGTPVTNCTISNCQLTNGTRDRSVVLLSDTSSFASPGYFSNITIKKNSFKRSLYGIYCSGATIPSNCNGLLIDQNDFKESGSMAISFAAIYLRGVDGASITNNVIGNLYGADFGSDKGIYVADTVRNSLISGNRIFNINNTSGNGWGAHGIFISTNLPNANLTVMNNMIGNITGDGNDYTNASLTLENPTGILVSCTGTQSGIRIYNNTIALGTVDGFTNTLNKSGAISSCIRIRTGSSAEIKNNILYNSLGLLGSTGFGATCILLSQNSGQVPILDYNNYHVAPVGWGAKLYGHIFNGNVRSTTLQAWKSATNKDVNSSNILPQFVSNTDFHLTETGNDALNNTGSFIPGCIYDFDSTSRGALMVDMGCDEFVPDATVNWVGKYSTDWFYSLNWEAGVIPNADKNLTLYQGNPHLPVLNNEAAIRNLSLTAAAAGTTLLTLGSDIKFRIFGNLTRTGGVVDAISGEIEMSSSNAQTIPNGFFKMNGIKNLLISNSSIDGVALDGPLDIFRSLKFSSLGFKLSTNGHLTMKSTINETSWIGNLTGKSIIGKVTVERYIPTGLNHGKSWQFLSVPVAGDQTINQAWQDTATAPNQNRYPGYGTQITSNLGAGAAGAVALGFDAYSAAGPSMKIYNTATNLYDGVASTNIPIQNKKGYMIFVRGSRSDTTISQTPTATILRTKGKLYTTGADAPPIDTVPANQFQTIGNPYVSAIDFTNLIYDGPPSIKNTFYLWDPKLGGTYGYGGFQTFSSAIDFVPIPGGTAYYPSGVRNTTIQSGQAFMIQGDVLGGTVTFTEDAKIDSSRLMFRTEPVTQTWNQDKQILFANLYNNTSGNPILVDGNALTISSSFSNNITADDAEKMLNSNENFAIFKQKKLSLEARQSITSNDTIQYYLSNLRVANYRFTFQPINFEGFHLIPYLVDQYNSTITPLSFSNIAFYDFNVINVAASYAPNRFYVIFRPAAPLPVRFSQVRATRTSEQNAIINWSVNNELQLENYDLEKSTDGRQFEKITTATPINNNGGFAYYQLTDENAGPSQVYYKIKAVSKDGTFSFSNIVKINHVKDESTISLVSNPVKGDRIKLFFKNMPEEEYKVALYNMEGRLLFRFDLRHNAADGYHEINSGNMLTPGSYQIRIFTGNGAVHILDMLKH